MSPADCLDLSSTLDALLQAVARLHSKHENLDWNLSTKNSALRAELLDGIPRLVGSGTAAQDSTFRSLLYSHGRGRALRRSFCGFPSSSQGSQRDASASQCLWSPISAHRTLELLGPQREKHEGKSQVSIQEASTHRSGLSISSASRPATVCFYLQEQVLRQDSPLILERKQQGYYPNLNSFVS